MTVDIDAQKRAAIAKCRRSIDAGRNLYEDGDLSRKEYMKRKKANEQSRVHWEAQTVETEKIALELVLCLEAINRINHLWEISDYDDKQGMVRNLFSSITYNLDTQRIVDFRLKPWADRLITLRTALYENENTEFEGNKKPLEQGSRVGKAVVLTGVRTAPLPSLNAAANQLIDRLYWSIPLPQKPITEKHIPKDERNNLICQRYAEGRL